MDDFYVTDIKHKAELIKKRYSYREKILKGKIRLPLKTARKLIGPDTAYHLYRFKKNR